MMGKPLLYAVVLLWMMPDLSLGITYKNKGVTPATLACTSTGLVQYTDIIKLYLSSENLEKDQTFWKLEIPRKLITLNEDINPIQEWFVTISLQEGLETYTTEGTLLDLLREPILQWQIGRRVNHLNLHEILRNLVGIKVTRSPCANDVAIIGIQSDNTISGFYLGVTFSGFWENNDTAWYDITNNICIYNDDEACQKSSLVEIVLTNHYLVILTTLGLFISSDLRYPNGTLQFLRAEFCGFSTEDFVSARLWYKELCLANQEDFEDDYLAITFEKSRTISQMDTCFFSSAPFSKWKACRPSQRRGRRRYQGQLLSFLIDHELKNAIYLYYKKEHSFVVVREIKNNNPVTHLRYPSFVFPEDFHTVTGMNFHPGSHFLYVYGNQVWISYDGANSFEMVGNFFNDVITSSYHSSYNNDIVFLSKASNLYFSKAGLRYYTRLGRSKLDIFGVYYDHVGTETLLTLTNQSLDYIEVISAFSNASVLQVNEDSEFETILAPQYITSSQIIFFAYVPQNSSMETKKHLMFHPRHVNRKLQLISHGEADIIKVMYHEDVVGFPSSAMTIVISPFAVVSSSSSPILLSSISIHEYNKPFYLIALHTENMNSHFKNSDARKTVVIPGYSSLLILKILNNTSALALATMPLSVPLNKIFATNKWLLYYFGTTADSMWVISTSFCKHMIMHNDVNTSASIMKYLDLGSVFNFKIKVVSSLPYSVRVHKTPFLKIVVGNVFLLDITAYGYWDETDSYIVEMSVVNRYFRKGVTTIALIVWEATTDCYTSVIIITLKSSCSYSKFMCYSPKYKISIDDWEVGVHRDKTGFNLIKTLPINYRPPSPVGLYIPITDNFYNADPSLPKDRNYHPQSKKTGIYKQCLNKTSREECNCTVEQKMSQNLAFSDCIEKVLRFMYPVVQYPIFLTIKLEDSSTPMETPYFVTVSEVNNRENWKLKQEVTKSTAKIKSYLENYISGAVYNPKDLNLSITGSELYHFRVKVIPGVTFCDLVAEFQIYVDNAPYPFPGRILIGSITAVIIGGIILVVFMLEIFDIHIWESLKNLVLRRGKEPTSATSIDID
ncbi:cation channel sperm-associated auxiliary subunit beta-like isoform X2 [Notamacropus eugenii]|uniref:cation channel sperm-associated auxiliary subunit beta-like isoform X2 n=1 Tax=Notamacropus eugenii TaxID=9315 RepID=UPI003B66D19B